MKVTLLMPLKNGTVSHPQGDTIEVSDLDGAWLLKVGAAKQEVAVIKKATVLELTATSQDVQ